MIMLEQIRTIDKTRIESFICRLPDAIMEKVNKAIKISLALYKEEIDSEKEDTMNELQIFNNDELDLKCRAMMNPDGSISVNAEDAAVGFGWTQEKNGKTYVKWERMNGFCKEFGLSPLVGKDDYIPESLFYRLAMKANNSTADRFQNWLAIDVIPQIRKTGSYQSKPMTIPEQIKLLAQGNVELEKKVEAVDKRIDTLEQDMPLYGCEIDEVKGHVNRKGVKVLGGKQSEAYRDASIRGSVYSDIYSQLKREYGCVSSYKSIKRKYIADVHEFIDCYAPPTVLAEQIDDANAQMNFGG